MPPAPEPDSSGMSPFPFPPLLNQSTPPTQTPGSGKQAGSYAAMAAAPRNKFQVLFEANPSVTSNDSPIPSFRNDVVHFVFQSHPIPSEISIAKAIRDIGPFNGINIMTVPRATTKVYETRFVNESDRATALDKGIVINKVTIPGLHPRQKKHTENQIKINIRNVDAVASPEEIVETLKKNLSHFGDVELVGIYQDNRFGCFIGEAIAIIDTSMDNYLSLVRTLQIPEWGGRLLTLSWKGAPVVCNFCKQEGHLKRSCPRIAELECTKCFGKGHSPSFCPVLANESASDWDAIVAMEEKEREEAVENQRAKEAKESKEDENLQGGIEEMDDINNSASSDKNINDNNNSNGGSINDNNEHTTQQNHSGMDIDKDTVEENATAMNLDDPPEKNGKRPAGAAAEAEVILRRSGRTIAAPARR